MLTNLFSTVLNVKAVVAACNKEKALVGGFSVIRNLRMDLFEALTLILLFQRCAAADNANDMGILGIQLLKPISAGMVQARCRAGGLCRCCSSAVQPAACDPTVPATCPTPLQWRPSCRKHRQVSAVDCKSDI